MFAVGELWSPGDKKEVEHEIPAFILDSYDLIEETATNS